MEKINGTIKGKLDEELAENASHVKYFNTT
jgi:hypothetical protein